MEREPAPCAPRVVVPAGHCCALGISVRGPPEHLRREKRGE